MEISELAFFFQGGMSAEWEMYLLKYNKKSQIYASDRIRLNTEHFRASLNELLNTSLDKIREYQGVIPYTEGVLSDGFLSEMETSDARINIPYTKMYESMLNAGTELANKYNGYILRGNTEEGKEILIINTGNPIVTMKGLMLAPVAEEFSEPVLVRMSKRADVIVLEGEIFAEPAKLETLFGLSSTARAICEANRKMVTDSKVFCESANAMLLNPRILRSFSVIEEEALKSLKERNDSARCFEKYAEIEYLSDGSIALLSERACKLAVKYLSGHVVMKDGKCYMAGTLEPLTEIVK